MFHSGDSDHAAQQDTPCLITHLGIAMQPKIRHAFRVSRTSCPSSRRNRVLRSLPHPHQGKPPFIFQVSMQLSQASHKYSKTLERNANHGPYYPTLLANVAEEKRQKHDMARIHSLECRIKIRIRIHIQTRELRVKIQRLWGAMDRTY